MSQRESTDTRSRCSGACGIARKVNSATEAARHTTNAHKSRRHTVYGCGLHGLANRAPVAQLAPLPHSVGSLDTCREGGGGGTTGRVGGGHVARLAVKDHQIT